jgi:hypothetical protein
MRLVAITSASKPSIARPTARLSALAVAGLLTAAKGSSFSNTSLLIIREGKSDRRAANRVLPAGERRPSCHLHRSKRLMRYCARFNSALVRPNSGAGVAVTDNSLPPQARSWPPSRRLCAARLVMPDDAGGRSLYWLSAFPAADRGCSWSLLLVQNHGPKPAW